MSIELAIELDNLAAALIAASLFFVLDLVEPPAWVDLRGVKPEWLRVGLYGVLHLVPFGAVYLLALWLIRLVA